MSFSIRIQRHLNILDYGLLSLNRRKFRNGSVCIVFAFAVFLFSSFQILSRGLGEVADTLLENVPDITVQQMLAGRQATIDIGVAEEIRAIFGVSSVVPRIWGYYFDESNGANYTVSGISDELRRTNPEYSLGWGRYPTGGATGEVVVHPLVRESLGLGERKVFSLFRPDLTLVSYRVVGEFAPSTSLGTADLILMGNEDARKLFTMESWQATDLLVTVGNERETTIIASKIAELVPGSRVITRAQIQKTYDVVFNLRSGFGFVCLLGMLAALLILVYDKASGLAGEELREMAVLKLLGWQGRDVMLLRFWESSVVALCGFCLGYGLAWVHVVWGKALLFAPVMLGWSVLRPDLSLAPYFDFSEMLVICSMSVLPYLCATIVPAWRSSVVRPETVI